MTTKRVLAGIALCLLLCLALVMTSDAVHAQGKALEEKHGFDVLNNDKVWKKPNKVQKAVGIGSCFVMIAVMRWL